jgi:RHS repeat-associated protein
MTMTRNCHNSRTDPFTVGNLTNIVYPVSPAISLSYDVLNRLTNMVDAVGTTVYGYDAAGQLLSEDGPWAYDTVNYTYANRLRTGLSLQAPNASAWSQGYGYDNARRLTGVNSPAGAFNYIYNVGQASLPVSISLPNGAFVTNTYDNVARLLSTALKNSGYTNLDSYTYIYNQAGQRTNVVRTAGDYVNYTYDNMGELKTATGKESGGVTNRWQEQLGYAYDAAGNLNIRTNNTLLQAFNVNDLNELAAVTNGGRLTVTGATTSPATNVTVNTSNAALYADITFASTNQPWVNGNNAFTAIAQDVYGRRDTNIANCYFLGANSYSYDLNGNLLNDGTRYFAYDDENELISVTVSNAWQSRFVYDGKMRRRIERDYTWNGGSWLETNEVHYIYDGNLVIQERNANNLPMATYTRGNDLSGTLQGAGGIGGLLARTDNSLLLTPNSYLQAFSYYHADGNGNVTYLIYSNQQPAAKYLYDPYGNTLSMSGPLAGANTYRFSSKEWNANSGLYYYLYRFYDPNLQRWPNRDPIWDKGFLVLHDRRRRTYMMDLRQGVRFDLYGFVGNDPTDKNDVLGLLSACYAPMWDTGGLLWHAYVQLSNGNTVSDEGDNSDQPTFGTQCYPAQKDPSCNNPNSNCKQSPDDCVKNAIDQDTGNWSTTHNCGAVVRDAFKKCCLKDPTPWYLYYP